MPDTECLILGRNKYIDEGCIVNHQSKEDKNNYYFRRSLNDFQRNDNDYQLLYFDYDGNDRDKEELTPEEFIEEINKVIPQFKDITKVVKYSSSANIYNKNNNELLSSSNGFHIYFVIKHTKVIEEMFKGNNCILSKKLWLHGRGWIKNSKNSDPENRISSQLQRTIVDHATFSRERIIFESKPELGDDLVQKNTEAYLIEGTQDYLDLYSIEGMTDKEQHKYERLVKEAKEKNRNSPYILANKNKFIASRTKKYKGNRNKAVLDYNRMNNKFLLMDSTVILDDDTVIKVEDILEKPEVYNNQCCYDVFDPEYNGSQCNIAKIYSLQKPMIIHSFAHGGIKYKLPGRKFESDYESWEYWKEHFFMFAAIIKTTYMK